ncbi:hypothetical protein L873DRAFT_1788949 [Choiromyces venosus 120613-1]|uniref:Uncharacterized protein n=1 Tax=Choiromyces venosus 120613-1 TaxID=1336337 RepID=A0A3N4K3V3_9PEZI|nr:hypothetical protein L873DRAFT_1788949 [Choiromyces venosus 120613-1]
MSTTPSTTVKTANIPKYITKTGMSVTRYFDLKVYIKSILHPGTPGFKDKRFETAKEVDEYRQWLDHALETIGPRFFPSGGSGLLWPRDYDGIYKAVHMVVRDLSYKLRKAYEKTAGQEREQSAKMEMEGDAEGDGIGTARGVPSHNSEDYVKYLRDTTQEHNHNHGKEEAEEEEVMLPVVVHLHHDKDLMVLGEKTMPEHSQLEDVMPVGQPDPDREATEQEMQAAAVEMHDLLDLMNTHKTAYVPDLCDADFDWEED